MATIVLPTFIPARVIQDIIHGADPGRFFLSPEALMNVRIGPNEIFTSVASWFATLDACNANIKPGTEAVAMMEYTSIEPVLTPPSRTIAWKEGVHPDRFLRGDEVSVMFYPAVPFSVLASRNKTPARST